MVHLPVTSSEALHSKAVDELRHHNSEAFHELVIQRLTKILDLRPNIFSRKCFTIHYTPEEVNVEGYNYCVLSDDDEAGDRRSGCFGFFCSPNRMKTIKFENDEPSDTQALDFDFLRHLPSISEFIMREENLREEEIFLKSGSREGQQKLSFAMQTSKFVDFHELGCSVHDCASVLKQYLLQMPEPLFPTTYYPAYERVAKLARRLAQEQEMRSHSMISSIHSLKPPDSELLLKEQHLIDCLQLITHLMSHRKRMIFGHIIEILEGVYANRAYNRTTANALGAIFAPLIICPRDLPRDAAFSVSRDMSAIITKMVEVGKEVFGAPSKFRLQAWKFVLHSNHRCNYLRTPVSTFAEHC